MDNNIKTNDNGQQQVQQPTPQYIIVKQQSNAALGYLYTLNCKNRTTRTTLRHNLLIFSENTVGLWIIIVLLWYYSDPTRRMR